MRTKVFISYARSDRAFADRLSADLRRDGIDAWLDTNEISGGNNWAMEIEDTLRSSSAVLYVASARSSQSGIVEAELRFAFARGIRVIPVVVDDEGGNLPLFLERHLYADFRVKYDDGLRTLLELLQPLRADEPLLPSHKKTKGYVFVSYAEEDAYFVDDLKAFLAKRGYAYWDYRESDRDYHHDLYLELECVISEAAATLSLISPDWKRSRTAIQEYHFSIEIGKPVFLLRVKDPGPTLVIAGIPFIDFTLDRTEAFARLERELSRKGL